MRNMRRHCITWLPRTEPRQVQFIRPEQSSGAIRLNFAQRVSSRAHITGSTNEAAIPSHSERTVYRDQTGIAQCLPANVLSVPALPLVLESMQSGSAQSANDATPAWVRCVQSK